MHLSTSFHKISRHAHPPIKHEPSFKVTMKKYIILVLLCVSCNVKPKKDLKIELLTNELFCIENFKTYQFMGPNYLPNKEYDSLSKNTLHYKITNISDKNISSCLMKIQSERKNRIIIMKL